MLLPYNPENKKSIIKYATLLKNKTLREVCDLSSMEQAYAGKGKFGQTLEKYYFFYEPNSDSEPDFPIAGLELKSTPLKILLNKEYRSKERLVLNIINYEEIVKQTFETSSFWKKNKCLLLIFYLYQIDNNILDNIIKLVEEWNFPESDLTQITKDWEKIKKKVLEGKAHELSEGDTDYLGACTKGSSSKTTRIQPNNKLPAKQRAFSLKQSYVNYIISSFVIDSNEIYGKIISSKYDVNKLSLEEIVLSKFVPYLGKGIKEITSRLNITLNIKAKNYYSNLTKSILGIDINKEIEEFEKADIKIKSIRVEEDGKIIESVSLEAFKFLELIEESWINSNLKSYLERKYLFIFFKQNKNERILIKAKFWNMPYNDIQEARKVWLQTKRLVQNGDIVKSISKKGIRKTNFLGKNDNPVSHVRPHALNAADTYPLPVTDKLTKAKEYTKHCFWLNNNYVRDEIFLKI